MMKVRFLMMSSQSLLLSLSYRLWSLLASWFGRCCL